MELYEDWQSKPGSEKIPPPDFLQDLYEECKRQGEEPVFSFDDVVDQFRNKRAQSDGYARQSGLRDFNNDDDSNGR